MDESIYLRNYFFGYHMGTPVHDEHPALRCQRGLVRLHAGLHFLALRGGDAGRDYTLSDVDFYFTANYSATGP